MEATRQLSDAETYKELSKEEAEAEYAALRDEKLAILNILVKEGNITKAESKRVAKEDVKMPSIYFLPKIHKAKREDTGTFSARPIIAAVGGMLKTLDEYLAKITAPLLPEIKGSLMDTGALIRNLASLKNLPASVILFSADVEALYPSIPWKEGVASATGFYASKFHVVRKWAEDNGTLPPPKPHIFKRLLQLILERNIFHFQDARFFRQLKGTAMGCSMSVFLANTEMFRRTRNLLDEPPAGLLYLGRYIDDLIGVWDGPEEEIESLFSKTVDNDIKLTYVIGGKRLEALDLLLELESGSIATSLYRKPTDGNQYVHWSSSHPTKLKASIPYAQLLRIKRNCSRPIDVQKESANLMEKFKERGYPRRVLEKALSKAESVTRDSLLEKGNGKNKMADRIILVTDFHAERAAKLRQDVFGFYDGLLQSDLVKERTKYFRPPLPVEPPAIAFRAGASLGSTLGPRFKRGPRE